MSNHRELAFKVLLDSILKIEQDDHIAPVTEPKFLTNTYIGSEDYPVLYLAQESAVTALLFDNDEPDLEAMAKLEASGTQVWYGEGCGIITTKKGRILFR